MFSQSHEIVPPPVFTKECVPVVVLLIVMTLPDEPVAVNVPTVCVVPVVNNRECAAVPVSFSSVNVFDPAIVILAVLAPLESHNVPYVLLPPSTVIVLALVLVTLIVPDVAVTVNPVDVVATNTVAVLVSVIVPLPSVRVLVLLLLVDICVNDAFIPLKSTVPLVRLICRVDVKAS